VVLQNIYVINTFADLFYQRDWRVSRSELFLFAAEYMSKARTHNADEKRCSQVRRMM